MAQVFDTLHHDHEKVAGLFEKIRGTTGAAEDTRLALCEQLKDELLAHTEFEEQVFYPALEEQGDEAAQEVSKAIQEHREVEQLLDEIEQLDPASAEFMESVEALEQSVLAHVRHEEDEIFPLAQRAIEADRAEQMSEQHDRMVEEHMQGAAGG